MATDSLAVQLTGIEKRFPGVIANHDVNLNVRAGTIHAIVGENGAGKSTLMKTLYGMHQPEAGTISVFGEHKVFRSPSDAIDAGIGMVHQHFMLADNFTVLENIILGYEPIKGGRVQYDQARLKLQDIMAQSGTHVDLDAPVSDLGVGQRQRVEILKVLFRGARILILDEPTAVLVPQEVDELFSNLHRLVADGATIIFISHKLDEVLTVSDDITVIRDGTTVAEVKPDGVTRSKLAELMVGSELPSPHGRASEVGSAVRLSVTGITVAGLGEKHALEDVTFEIHEGEVLGIAGVEGNGQFELCETIIGLTKPIEGSIVMNGDNITHASPHHRLMSGLSYIPFDRHREGLLLDAPLWENTLLGRDGDPQFLKGPFINAAAAKADSREVIERFDVRTPSELVPAYALSGGNQQKLLVGRELSSHPNVLIAAHPTRGVDIGAQAAIWEKLRAARDAGLAVLLISADLEEVIGLSDRILVMFDGHINAHLTPAEATPELLGTYMTGGVQEVAS
ncbi:MAG: ABC transporter ATP-binding protein [Actinomycetota bacterium]|nr:ABC transporter ATP-binding protein [Actinomycetota bacterium]